MEKNGARVFRGSFHGWLVETKFFVQCRAKVFQKTYVSMFLKKIAGD